MTSILFAGSPGIAVPALRAVSAMEAAGEGLRLAGVLTNADSKQGRGGKGGNIDVIPTEVSKEASRLDGERAKIGLPHIPQLKFESLYTEARAAVSALAPDILVSFAYGRVFGPRFLGLFPLGGINVHPSLLPRHRGASPLPAAIIAGDNETGISIQRIAPEMDAGDLLATEVFPISPRETTESLTEKAAGRGAALLAYLLGELCRNREAFLKRAAPQTGQATYTRLIKKEDGLINWGLSAASIDARIRAYTPWPLSYTRLRGEALFILEAAPAGAGGREAPPGTVLEADKDRGILVQTGDGVLAVSRLQARGKKALDWKSFLNGARGFLGARLE